MNTVYYKYTQYLTNIFKNTKYFINSGYSLLSYSRVQNGSIMNNFKSPRRSTPAADSIQTKEDKNSN